MRSYKHSPRGYCDACGKWCGQPFQVFKRCYWCFAGVFLPAELFYLLEYDDVEHAIPLQEIAEPPAEALTVNVTEPPAEVLRARAEAWDRRFEVGDSTGYGPSRNAL